MRLSNTAFWDVNQPALDEEVHADFIIRKVFNFGLFADIIEVLNRYPEEKIIRSLTTAPWLEKKTLTFSCNIFNLKPSDFRCFLKTQSTLHAMQY